MVRVHVDVIPPQLSLLRNCGATAVQGLKAAPLAARIRKSNNLLSPLKDSSVLVRGSQRG
jgi:hypothetical protein